MSKLLYVDAHPPYREGFARILGAELAAHRVETAPSRAAALEKLAAPERFALLLVDQPIADEARFVSTVRERFPETAVGVPASDPTPPLCRRLRAAGAIAGLSKQRSIPSLAEAVRALLAGGEAFDAGPDLQAAMGERRREIVHLAAHGLADKPIGARLSISESTVRNHWRHVFQRLGAANRTAAVSKALRSGLIAP